MDNFTNMNPTNPTPQLYILKVALIGAKRIWRKIAIREDQKLSQLHDIIYEAFDRFDEHLYSFHFPSKKTNRMRTLYDSPQCSHPMALEGSPGDANAQKTTLSKFHLQPGQVFYYLFDFGDCWWHEITVESMRLPDKARYPIIVARNGKSPEQYEEYDENE